MALSARDCSDSGLRDWGTVVMNALITRRQSPTGIFNDGTGARRYYDSKTSRGLIILSQQKRALLPLSGAMSGRVTNLWVKQLGEPGIIGHVLKVGIIARLEAIGRIQTNGLIQIAQAVLRAIRKAVQ